MNENVEPTGKSRVNVGGNLDVPEEVPDAAIARMRLAALLLDDAIRVPGTPYRFGIDPVLGILPGAGDVIAGGLSLYIVAESARQGVRNTTLIRMLVNIAIDVAGGSIPIVGDLFDAVWKANRRNVELAFRDFERKHL